MTDAAIYVRISADQEALALGVERQEQDCRAKAAELGLDVVQVFSDNNISASRKGRKPRPGYSALIEAARAGKFTTVIAYSSSRLTRRPRELEDLIDLSEHRQVRFVYCKSPEFDLNTGNGRMVARVLISVDANESDVVGERVKRKIVERAEAGLHHGPWAPFGYRHAAGGGIEPHPQHAEWVREALRRLLAGDTLYGICTSWDREGRRTPQGAVWRPRSLKTMLLRPTLVGLRVHDGVTYEGQWPAIVDAESWQRVGNLLRAPERKIRNFSSGTARKYALSGLVRCGRCEHVMTAMTASGQRSPSFICSKIATGGCGQMRISMDPLEDWVRDEVVDALDWMRWSKLIPERSTDFSDAAAVLAEEVEAMRRLTEDYYAPGNSLSPDEFRRLRHLSLKRQEAGERYLNFLAEKSRIDSIPKGEALREMWKTESSTWRREVTALAIEYLSISPFPKHMTSTVTKRKSESAEEFSQRKAEHAAKILDARVSVCFCS